VGFQLLAPRVDLGLMLLSERMPDPLPEVSGRLKVLNRCAEFSLGQQITSLRR